MIGVHDGIINYTIGQRKGIKYFRHENPLYVIKIIAEKNEIIVGSKKIFDKKKNKLKNLNIITKQKRGFWKRIICKSKINWKIN